MAGKADPRKIPVAPPMDAVDALLREEEERSGRRGLDDKLTEEERHAFYDQSSDRAMAVLLGAIVENHLTGLLRLYMRRDEENVARELFQPSGPLGPFGTKIRVAYMLRIIGPDLYRDLTAVSKIRNKFAHDLTVVKFDSAPVRDWIQGMYMYGVVREMAEEAQSRLDSGTSSNHIADAIASDFTSSITDTYRACLRFLIHWIIDQETAIIEAEKRMNSGSKQA